MQPVISLDPSFGPHIKFARSAQGRWRVDGRPARMAAEIANDDDGNLIVTEIDPDTGAVVETRKIEVAA